MWRVTVFIGFVVWLATIGASGAVNYLAGYEFGRTPAEAQVFAILGLAADAWKALGPIFILTLWRAKRFVPAALASVLWSLCFVFAVTAALGLAAQNRSALTSAREGVRASYASIAQSLTKLSERRAAIGDVSSSNEYEAEIAAAFAAPAMGGTIGSLSENCGKDVARTRLACAEIARLREDLARAVEAKRLDDAIAESNQKLQEFRKRGGTLDADPQAKLIARLTFGYVAAANVPLLLMTVLVAMVEVISAFAPVVLREFVAVHRGSPRSAATDHATSRSVAPPVVLRPVANLFEYLAERIVPDDNGVESEVALFTDYQEWSREHQYVPIEFTAFIQELDVIAARELSGRVRRRRKNFHGLRLISGRKRLSPPARGR